MIGHEIVAKLGHYALSAQKQKELESLIPYADLGEQANWPDTVKKGSAYEWSFFLHFTGFQEPDGAHLAPPARQNADSATGLPLFHPSYKLNVSETGVTAASHSCRWIDMNVDCNKRVCLVTGLSRFINDISNGTLLSVDEAKYLEAMKFVMHFIGDAHQLLHICNIKYGANLVKLQYGEKKTDLHKVWDNDLVQASGGALLWWS